MNAIELNQLLSEAVIRELEAHDFYTSLVGQIANQAAKDIFLQLAKEELAHKERLEKLLMDPSLAMGFSAEVFEDWKVAESLEDRQVTPDMGVAESLVVAIKKEQAAMQIYQQLMQASHEAAVKDLFRDLSKMEQGHKIKLERLYLDLGFPEAF